MQIFTDKHNQDSIDILLAGGIGVIRTDTLYGIVACAMNEAAVSRVYQLKGRDDEKAPIVLIAGKDQLWDGLSQLHAPIVDNMWPGPVSIILPSKNAPIWIRRSNASVAYRLPDDDALRELLEKTGPLIAPSANPQGRAPATNIQEAIDYFRQAVDFYIDEGQVADSKPSSLVRLLDNGTRERLR